ncbi:MAG: hypothetical protein C0625_02100 [Arcobacter sp.]|nr:MAG: hypothetical protein C0625_02100 [Arcobacter sp.]
MSILSKLNPLSWIADIVKEPIVEWQKRKTLKVENEAKELDREHEVRLKKMDIAAKLAEKGQQVEADWDTNAQNNMKHSWKDEWFVFLFSIPLIAAFIPHFQPYILEGFKTLKQTPDWYMWLVVGIVIATFGLRWMFGRIKIR